MDFWNTIEEIKEQYFMKMRYAVLEILQEGRWAGRNVERKTLIFVNFDFESSENGDKKIVFLFVSAGKRNTGRKVQRPTPTVLTHSTFTMFTQIVSATSLYLQ
jgi:hypothetical protein